MSQLYAVTGRRYIPNIGAGVRAQAAHLPSLYQLRDQKEAQDKAFDLQERGLGLQTEALEQDRLELERNTALARQSMEQQRRQAQEALKQQRKQTSQSNILGMAGLGVNYGLGSAKNRAIFADTGSNMAGDVAGTASQFGVSNFGPNISRSPSGLTLGDTGVGVGEAAVRPQTRTAMSGVGDFVKNYGGALAGGLGGALMGDNTKERVLYGLGGAAIGDLVSGGSLLKDVIGGALDWAGTGFTKLFGW